MKKYFGALLLLPLVLLVMAQFAAAQETMSAVLSTPYNSRPGSQLLFFFVESEKDNTGAFLPVNSGDTYKSYMTVTNVSTDTNVLVHYQFYNVADCNEVFDYVDVLTAQDTNEIDPQALQVVTGESRGLISGGRFLMTVTAIDATLGQGVDTRAISFNYLIGQQFITNIMTGAAWGGNAVSRMAVNFYGAPLDAGSCFTTPKDFTSYMGRFAIGDATAVYNSAAGTYSYVGCNTSLGGVIPGFVITGYNGLISGGHVATTSVVEGTRLLQMFRPATLIIPHFFAPSKVYATGKTVALGTSKQFGNRLTVVSLDDSYNATGGTMHKLVTGTTKVASWFIDNYEQTWSIPTKSFACVEEKVLSPRKADGTYAGATTNVGGVGVDLIGTSAYSAVADGGYLKMNVVSYGGTILFGWFSQSLSGGALSAGVGDLLVGLGRTNWSNLPATDAAYINNPMGTPSAAALLSFSTLPSAVTP